MAPGRGISYQSKPALEPLHGIIAAQETAPETTISVFDHRIVSILLLFLCGIDIKDLVVLAIFA